MAILKYKDKNGNFVVLPTGGGSGSYELPIASTETLGGVKIGENLTITEDGTLNAKASSGSSQVVYGGIDMTNVIYELTSSVEGTEWVATEDCYFIGELVASNNTASLWIDGVQVAVNFDTSTSSIYFPIFILKGQTIKYFAVSNNLIRTGKLYGLKKSENILHEYSTEEKVVGKWIDGKDIYERVIVLERFVVNANSWYETNIIFNFDKTLKCYLITDDGIGYPAIVSQNNGKMTVRHFRNDNLGFNTIIVQYIKTE